MILNLGIGLNTPPLGPVQFVAAAVGKITIWEAMRSIWPFYGAGLVVLLLVTYIPALSLWLPARLQIGVRMASDTATDLRTNDGRSSPSASSSALRAQMLAGDIAPGRSCRPRTS